MYSLTFSVKAWTDIQYILHKSPGEIAFYCITRDPARPDYVTEIFIPAQLVSAASAEPTAEGLAQMTEHFLTEGLEPQQFFRIWGHTHPAGVHAPSKTDWDTFAELFADSDYGIMLILAKDGWTGAWYTAPHGPLGDKPGTEASAVTLRLFVDWCSTDRPDLNCQLALDPPTRPVVSYSPSSIAARRLQSGLKPGEPDMSQFDTMADWHEAYDRWESDPRNQSQYTRDEWSADDLAIAEIWEDLHMWEEEYEMAVKKPGWVLDAWLARQIRADLDELVGLYGPDLSAHFDESPNKARVAHMQSVLSSLCSDLQETASCTATPDSQTASHTPSSVTNTQSSSVSAPSATK